MEQTRTNMAFESIGWPLLTVVGLTILVVGVVDLSLGLYPLSFGTPEWELGAISNLLDRLPLAGLGLCFLLTAALATKRAALTYLWSLALISIGLLVFVFGIFYATNLPLVLAALPTGGPARVGIYKAMAKTGVQVAVFFFGFFFVAILGFRAPGRFSRKS
jgi:hypothetical protein